jgi:hypothetical protein
MSRLMRGTLLPLAILMSVVASATAAPAPAPAPAPPATAPAKDAKDTPPTMAELRQQFKDGKHQDVLKQVQRLLQLKGDAAKPYDRYELFCLRGESFLRIKSMTLAADAFDDAADVAKDDSKKEGVARGTAVLIRRSKQIGYVPRPAKSDRGKPAPAPSEAIQIIEATDRKAAFARLLEDERAAVVPKLEAAQKGTSLPPIIDVAKMLGDLQAVEIASTGKGEQTQGMTKDLAARSHDLIATALNAMNDAIEAAWDHASTETWEVDRHGNRIRMIGRVGLHGDGAANVRFAVQQSELLAPAAAILWRVTKSDKLKRDAEIADALWKRALYIAEYPYNGRRPGRPFAPRAPTAR